MPYLFGIFNISDHQNQQVDIHQQVSLVDVHQPSHTWGPTPWAKLRQEYYATPEQGRVIGISASLLLLLWCYWITTLKVRADLTGDFFWGLIPKKPAKKTGWFKMVQWFLGSIIFSLATSHPFFHLMNPNSSLPVLLPLQWVHNMIPPRPNSPNSMQEVPPMMRETQKDGPKDLRPVSLEELKKHSHQAGSRL